MPTQGFVPPAGREPNRYGKDVLWQRTKRVIALRSLSCVPLEVNGPFLHTWSQQLARWIQQGITLYVFCHCPFEVHSPTICVELYRRVQALVPIPHSPGGPRMTMQDRSSPVCFDEVYIPCRVKLSLACYKLDGSVFKR